MVRRATSEGERCTASSARTGKLSASPKRVVGRAGSGQSNDHPRRVRGRRPWPCPSRPARRAVTTAAILRRRALNAEGAERAEHERRASYAWMTIPVLYRFADGRQEATCSQCLAQSIAIIADIGADAWAILQKLGWSVHSPEGGDLSQPLCPGCTAYPNLID